MIVHYHLVVNRKLILFIKIRSNVTFKKDFSSFTTFINMGLAACFIQMWVILTFQKNN